MFGYCCRPKGPSSSAEVGNPVMALVSWNVDYMGYLISVFIFAFSFGAW